MKNELDRKVVKEFVGLRAKTYSYFKGNNDRDKKEKCIKKLVIKRKLKFQGYKNCLEAAQIENKINHLEKDKIEADSLNEDKKEFIENNKLILKTQQRFKIKRQNGFTEEINKIS